MLLHLLNLLVSLLTVNWWSSKRINQLSLIVHQFMFINIRGLRSPMLYVFASWSWFVVTIVELLYFFWQQWTMALVNRSMPNIMLFVFWLITRSTIASIILQVRTFEGKYMNENRLFIYLATSGPVSYFEIWNTNMSFAFVFEVMLVSMLLYLS